MSILNKYAVLRQRRATFLFETIWGDLKKFYKGFYIKHQIVMRNVAVLFITQERLRADIFIDTIRTFKGLKCSVDSKDRFHLQEEIEVHQRNQQVTRVENPEQVPGVG